MGKTAFATGNALTRKAWQEKLFRDTKKEAYFARFMGSAGSDTSIVHVEEKLTKERGDQVTFGIRMRLSGAGVTSGTPLEGNEESLTTYDYPITLEQYRHAVRDDGAMTRKRASFSISQQSENALKDWGSEKIDELIFTALQLSPTKIFYGGSASSTATLTASDKLTPALISKVKTWSLTGGNRAQTPLRPVKVDGKNYFILLVHPDVMYDLKLDSTFAQARREALLRGNDNPIFSGSEAIWDGVVIHEHENIDLYTTWGSGSDVTGATCAFMGAQAICYAWGMRPDLVNKKFDYDNEQGYAWGMIAKAGKPVFNSLDYGSVGVYVSRTQIADA